MRPIKVNFIKQIRGIVPTSPSAIHCQTELNYCPMN